MSREYINAVNKYMWADSALCGRQCVVDISVYGKRNKKKQKKGRKENNKSKSQNRIHV